MPMAPTTIADLFANDPAKLSGQLFSDEGGAHLREVIRNADPVYKAALATVGDEDIAGSVFEMLGEPLADVLRTAWNDLFELQEYLDPKRHPPGETSKVGVARHTLSTKWEPKLDLKIDGKTVRQVSFEVALKLKVEGTVLTVRDRRVWEAASTRISGQAEMRCEGFKIMRCLIEPVQLPGSIHFTDGLPIPELID